MEKAFGIVNKITDWLIIITTCLMCFFIFIQVISRYIFSSALPWPEEVGRFLFLWVTYLGISRGMRSRSHLCMDIFILYMPKKLKKYFSVLSSIITAAFFLFICYVGLEMTFKVHRIEQLAVSVPIPIWLVWGGIPLSAALTFLQCCRNAALLAMDKADPNPQGGEL